MLVAAAVLPHPPVLVPELASGAAPELEPLRLSCRAAVDALWAVGPDVVYVVGTDTTPHATSLAPWGGAGADVRIDVPEPLPLSLLVGGWLTSGRIRSFVAVDDDLDPDECAQLGAELAESAGRVALAVMGDGAARHSEKAPGYLDERAAPFDATVAAALATGDVQTLLAIDPDDARAMLAAGRAPWQVLAGAAVGQDRPTVTGSEFLTPYGVGYHLVTWAWQEFA